jgi:hypothetical protein
VIPGSPLDARAWPCHHPRTDTNTGCERDEYASNVGRETRWLVETGAAAARNGPGSLRTEQRNAGDARLLAVGSGAERQRYRAAPIATGRVTATTPSVTMSAAHAE